MSHSEAFKCRVRFSLAYLGHEKSWLVVKVDAINSEAANFSDLFDALEYIKDQYRTNGVHLGVDPEFTRHKT